MGFISHFLAGGLFNRSEMNKKLDEISALTEPAWKLIDTIDNTVGYSGEWEAPDVFGDGSAYDLGVYMIGGGSSGNVHCYTDGCRAVGGASGEGKNAIIESVSPGVKYAWVIGKGGAAVTKAGTASNSSTPGNAGGTTSFNGVTASGGSATERSVSIGSVKGTDGGQGSDGIGDSSEFRTVAPAMCAPTLTGESNGEAQGGATQSPREGQNLFDLTMRTLGAGGGVIAGVTNYTQTTPELTHGHGGAGSTGTTGKSATGYGNGGGGVAKVSDGTSSTTYKSGAGSDGVIFLYARKAVTE